MIGGYGRKQVVFDVNLHVGPGEIVSMIGHNGGGKTTTLKTIFGMLPLQSGEIRYQGRDISRSSCRQNVKRGMLYIPSERFVFGDLTVLDNLRMGGLHERSSEEKRERMARVYELFPILAERANQKAGTMSGGSSACSAWVWRSWRGRSCCCSTSRRSAWRRRWSPRSSPGQNAGRRGRPVRPGARAERGPGPAGGQPGLRHAQRPHLPGGDRR